MTAPALTLTFARQAIDRAADTYARELAKLYTPDGKPIYTDTDARKQKLLESVRKAVDDARKTADEHRVEAQRKRLTAYADPVAALNVLDLEKAFYRRAFVADDAASMPLPDLARRVEATATNKADSVGAALYAVYARRRYESEVDARRKAGSNAVSQDMAALGQAVMSLEAATQPDKKAIDAEAAEMEKAGWELTLYAGRQLADLDGSSAGAWKVRL